MSCNRTRWCEVSGVKADVVAAVDINHHANLVYAHNFPQTPVLQKTIEVPFAIFLTVIV